MLALTTSLLYSSLVNVSHAVQLHQSLKKEAAIDLTQIDPVEEQVLQPNDGSQNQTKKDILNIVELFKKKNNGKKYEGFKKHQEERELKKKA